MNVARVLQPSVEATSPVRVAGLFRQIAGFIDNPPARASVSLAAEAADMIAATMQVRDRLDKEWPGRWLVLVYITATATGDPVNTQATAFSTGAVFYEIEPDQAWVVRTDDDGVAVLEATIVGAATRFVHALVLGLAESKEATWT